MPVSKANARWEGTLMDGKGTMRLPSGTYEGPYNFVSRFEKGAGKDAGTNPEELIAAAHAGCYAMALSGRIVAAGFTAESIDAEAQITMSRGDDGVAITKSHLIVRAKVPGMSDEAFQQEAAAAKEGCPVSRALAALEITLDAELA